MKFKNSDPTLFSQKRILVSGGLFSESELLENRTIENKLQKFNSRKTKREDEIFITLKQVKEKLKVKFIIQRKMKFKQTYNHSSINGEGEK